MYRPPPPRFRADSFIDLGFNTLTFSRDLQDWNNPPGFSSSPRCASTSTSTSFIREWRPPPQPVISQKPNSKKKKKEGLGGRLFSQTCVCSPRLSPLGWMSLWETRRLYLCTRWHFGDATRQPTPFPPPPPSSTYLPDDGTAECNILSDRRTNALRAIGSNVKSLWLRLWWLGVISYRVWHFDF